MRVAIVMMLALSACGPSFRGTYSGTLSVTASCSNGQGDTASGSSTWTIQEDGPELAVTTPGTCGALVAMAEGNVARVQQKTCPVRRSNGYTYSETIVGGTLTLAEESIIISVQSTVYVSGLATGTCNTSWSGSLARTSQ
jgi:hypothetical protein